MACIKSVNRSATVALSPDAPYLAAGTMAGAVDLSFSTSAHIEIFKLDFQSDDTELPLLGQSTSAERFNRLSWGKNGSNSKEFSLGLIAGGLVDGKIGIWNPHTLLGPESGADPLVAHLARHNGPVRGLEFNSFTPHMLASGADDGEICIWDLANLDKPSHFPPLRGNGSAAQGEISYLSWNSKVQHILASASYNGTVVVWDLKKQKPVISLQEPNRRRCSVLQWNPDLATQLVIASDDDDDHPILRLWDTRNTMSPVKEFVGHNKGVISMSWCPIDSSNLLTCAKDNRTICWDTLSGEIVCELPAGTNWNFDVHWYPKISGVISASSFDGKIGLYNIEACNRYGIGEADFVPGPLRAPKDLTEKTIVFFLATGQKQLSSALCKLFEKYSEILASQGLLSTTMEYLKLLGEDLSPELLILRDRIAFSTESVEEEAPAVHTGAVDAANQTNHLMTEDSQYRYQIYCRILHNHNRCRHNLYLLAHILKIINHNRCRHNLSLLAHILKIINNIQETMLRLLHINQHNSNTCFFHLKHLKLHRC